MNLTLDERTKIFDKVCRLVETKHFNPGMNGVDWNALVRDRRDQILACTDPEVFEKEVHKLLAELKTSHTGFRHAGMRNIPARHAINATLQRIGVNGTERWMFQDVHQGGPAFAAGIRPGDLLLECGGREVRPPNDLTFSVGESANLLIEMDIRDVEHSIEVTAETLYEAIATALAALQQDNCVGEIGQGFATVTVLVQQPPVKHEVKIKDFVSWLGRQGRSPAEVILKQKLEKILGKVNHAGT